MPVALRYGVPYEVFWKLNPKRLEAWQLHYSYNEQDRKDELDYLAWLTGSYVRTAIVSALDGNKKAPYPEEPYSITQIRSKMESEQKRADKNAASNFLAYALALNKKLGFTNETEK